MSIWSRTWESIRGGWKTYGPNTISGDGAFANTVDDNYDPINSEIAIRLSAVWSCMHLRAETIGSLPCHLRDKDKNIIKDHELYSVIHDSPNAMQTAPEYWSLMTANLDMHGNALSIIEKASSKRIISLEPIDPTEVSMKQKKSGAWYYVVGQEEFPVDRIFHIRGFTTRGYWGLPRIDVGREIMSAQISANVSAQRAFKQSLKIGGFFEVEKDLNDEGLKAFHKRLDEFGRAENYSKYLTLLKGMKPVSGSDFKIKPADAELLSSRYFGIEEICRLFNTPPQLIGHSDKASSWASSLEQVNLFFLMYSLMPTIVRKEARIQKSLVSPLDRSSGVQAKFSIQGLLRSDLKARYQFYASALQNGYYNRDEIRDLEERGAIPGGDEYTIQLNMGSLKGNENVNAQ